MYNQGDTSFALKPKRVQWETIQGLPEMIRTYLRAEHERSFYICFHGGEPLLVGKDFFSQMVSFLRAELSDVDLRLSVQTNGTLIDDQWADIFNHFRIDCAVSLDGPPHVNGRHRRDHAGRDSSDAAIAAIKLLQRKCQTFAGVLAVVDGEADGGEVVRYFADELHLEWFDLLLPDWSYATLPKDYDRLTVAISEFMISAFDVWYPLSRRGISCRFFESIISGLLGRRSWVDTIGRDGLGTLVLETDGSLEVHDVLRICPGFPRSSGIRVSPHALQEFYSSAVYHTAENLNKHHSPVCRRCDIFPVCRGGHMSHRYSARDGFLNPSTHCSTLYRLITHIQKTLGAAIMRAEICLAA
jgi:uncharacterized protein